MATKPSTRKRRVFTWYIEPLDLNTNESLARELSEENAMDFLFHDSVMEFRPQVYQVSAHPTEAGPKLPQQKKPGQLFVSTVLV